jgi:hypothetical protein
VNTEGFGDLLFWLLVAMGVALAIAFVGLALLWRSIRRLNVPADAGYFETMRYVPLALVVVLDLLDFGLDIFAAPVSWLILDRLGLRGLRNKAAVEALIPFTQPIPTFTLSWVGARVFGLGDEPFTRVIEGEARETRPRLQ